MAAMETTATDTTRASSKRATAKKDMDTTQDTSLKERLSRYLCVDERPECCDETALIECRRKQAGIACFNRYVLEVCGMRRTFESLDEALGHFGACVDYSHNANLWLGYVMDNGDVFVCDRAHGFEPLYWSCFAFPFGRGRFSLEMFKKNLSQNGFV